MRFTRPPLLITLFLIPLLSGCGDEPRHLSRGDPAPGFTAETLSGGRLTLPADTRGQIVALRFWADWCAFCEEEMNTIEPLYQELNGRGLEVLAVNVDQQRERVQRFVDGLEISYPVLLDPGADITRMYGIVGIPATLFIDRQGRVHSKILGESDAVTFRKKAEELL